MNASRRRHLALALFAALAAGRATAAPSARIVSLLPAATAGAWILEVEARGGKAPLTIWIDGKKVAATEGPAGRLKLSQVPARAERVEIGLDDKSGPMPLAAVRFGSPVAPALDRFAIYHVMVEMFANGNPRNDGEITGWRHPTTAGGDLQGVLDHVDHLARLGVDAVWLSPIFASRSSHGYDVTNYFRIGDAVGVPGDPAASLALFRKLRDALHDRGIRLILDIPLNHAAGAYERPAGDPQNLRPRATGPRQAAEKVWDSWGSGYRYWDFDHAPTRRFLIDVALHWLRDEGVDGLRLDYVRGVPHDFWAELHAAVATAKPGALLLGECWLDADGADANAREIATYAAPLLGRPQFDALLDFPGQVALTAAFARGGPATELEATLQASEAVIGAGGGQDVRLARFLDNHDLARFLAWADSPARLVAALGYLASRTGPIVLYYGTETGLAHAGPKGGFTDVGRIPMPWGTLDARLVEQTSRLLALRRDHPALASGGRLPLYADRDLLIEAKRTPAETLLVAVNLSAAGKTVAIATEALLPAGTTFSPLAGDGTARLEGGKLELTLPPLSTSILAAVAPAAGAP